MNYALEPYFRYFSIWGRSTRREYWAFHLFVLALYLMVVIASLAMGASFEGGDLVGGGPTVDAVNLVFSIFVLISLIPMITVTIRRLHDSGRSGIWIFIPIIPLIGGLVLLYFTLVGGDEGTNEYGPDPRF